MIKDIQRKEDDLGWYALLRAIDNLYYLQSRGLFNTPQSLKERKTRKELPLSTKIKLLEETPMFKFTDSKKVVALAYIDTRFKDITDKINEIIKQTNSKHKEK